MKKLQCAILLIFLLGSIELKAAKDTVAVLVDDLVYNQIKTEVDDYVVSVEAEFPVKLMVFHDCDWKNKSFYETREFIKDKWVKYNIKGVVLIGYFPMMLYQVKGQGSFPMVQALGYEDIDGTFTNEGTFDNSDFVSGKLDPVSLKDAHGQMRVFSDTIYDHHKWASNIDYSDVTDVENKVKIELWCAVIRPYQDVYDQTEYTQKAVFQLKEYLKKCTRYCRKELPYNRRGFVQASKDWSSSVSGLADRMKPIYGENNVVSYPSSSSGYTYMYERAKGLETACYFAHSSSWYHQNERSPFSTIKTSDIVAENGPGAILTLGFNCHGADFFETPTGCLGQHYIFEGNGLAFVGNTISTGNNQSSILKKMSEGAYLGHAFLETLNEDYLNAAKRGSSVRDQQMWGNIILGNPFIWVQKDKDMSYHGATVSGIVSSGEDAVLTFYKNNNIYFVNETKNGQINVSKLDTGKYVVGIETLNGEVIPSKELTINQVGQTITDWNIEAPRKGPVNKECYYLVLNSSGKLPNDWRRDGANLRLWNKTTARIIGENVQDYPFFEQKKVTNPGGNILIRKHFSINNLKPGTTVSIYSSCKTPSIYVNGVFVGRDQDFAPRNFISVFNSHFDITDQLVDGENFIVGFSSDIMDLSDPVYEMENEPIVSIPIKPTNFSTKTAEDGSLYFCWEDNSDDENGFLLEQKTESGEFEIVSYIGMNKTELAYSVFENSEDLIYRLCAYNYAGKSSYSDEYLITGIEDLSKTTAIKIFPNPFNDKITIQNASPKSHVCIRNLLGQVVFQSRIQGGGQEIDLSALKKGVFIISVVDVNKKPLTTKLVKHGV